MIIDKKGWENYWYYYKWHTIVGIFIAIVLIISLKDCSNRVDPDLSIVYIGENYIKDEVAEQLKDYLSEHIKDINANDKVEIVFLPLVVPEKPVSEQDFVIHQRIMLEYAAGDSLIYFIDKNNLNKAITQGAFQSLDELIEKEISYINETSLVKLKLEEETEEHTYAISLENNEFMRDIGFPTKDLYMAQRTIREKEKKDEKKIAEYENANITIREIIKYVSP